MSCKKEGCCRQERPRAEMGAIPDWVVKQLLMVAQSGFKNLLPWPNESVQLLAEKIAALVIENELLRKLLDRDTKPNPVVTNDTLAFTFGQDNQYTLHIPAKDPAARAQLVKSLQAAVAELNTHKLQAQSEQLDLPFTE